MLKHCHWHQRLRKGVTHTHIDRRYGMYRFLASFKLLISLNQFWCWRNFRCIFEKIGDEFNRNSMWQISSRLSNRWFSIGPCSTNELRKNSLFFSNMSTRMVWQLSKLLGLTFAAFSHFINIIWKRKILNQFVYEANDLVIQSVLNQCQ